jgi:uncharacterized membrane protein
VPISKLIYLYLITTLVFFAIDFVWLSTATSRIYRPYLGDLLADSPNLPVAAVFYLFYVVGVLALAVIPALQDGNVGAAIWRAAIFGALAYGTYDLTNLATIRGWAWQVSVIDIIWGTVLTSVVATAGYYAAIWLGLGD